MTRQQQIAAVLFAAGLGLLAAAWFFLAVAPADVEVAVRKPVPEKNVARKKGKRRWRGGGKTRKKTKQAEAMQLPEEGIAPTTDSCRYIVEERQRGVHAFIVMDNIRDQGIRFNASDIACMSASGVDDSLIRYAEFDMNSRMLDEDQVVGVQ